MTWYLVHPDDTFLIRDGRTMDAGEASFNETVLPHPSTLGGIFGAAISGRFAWLRGPYLAQRESENVWTPFLAMPRDVVVLHGEARRSRVRPLPVQSSSVLTSSIVGTGLSDLDAAELGDGVWDYQVSLISSRALERYLKNPEDAPDESYPEVVDVDELLPREGRVGLALEDGRARDGFLYQATHRRPHAGVAFLVEVDAGDTVPSARVAFGGAGRRASIEAAPPTTLPAPLDAYPDGRVLLYLATPAVWPSGALPPLPVGTEVVGSAIGPAEAVAIGGGKSTALYWAVPAGSVYFLKFADENAAHDWAREHHGKALGDGELASTGFGVILTGQWRFANRG